MANKSANKDGVLNWVSNVAQVPKADVEKVLDTFTVLVSESAKMGIDVPWPNLGKFISQQRAARVARNPRTGESVNVPARTVVKFKPAVHLSKKVNGEI